MTVKAMRTDEEGWKKGDGGPMLEEQVSFNGQVNSDLQGGKKSSSV